MARKSEYEILTEAIIKQFPKSRDEHDDRMEATRLHKAYHQALAHARTLSDNDLAARVDRHSLEHAEKMEADRGHKPGEHGNQHAELHFKSQAYAYEHRRRKGLPHPEHDSYTPEYVDRVTKDRY